MNEVHFLKVGAPLRNVVADLAQVGLSQPLPVARLAEERREVARLHQLEQYKVGVVVQADADQLGGDSIMRSPRAGSPPDGHLTVVKLIMETHTDLSFSIINFMISPCHQVAR